MLVRVEEAPDHHGVERLHVLAFGDQGPAVARLVSALRESGKASTSLVMEDDGAIVGHLMFSAATLDCPTQLLEVQVLSPVAVLPDAQGRGVGSTLIRRGIEMQDNAGAPMVCVEGHPAFYSRFGFEPGSQRGLRKPSLRIPDEAFAVIALSAYEPWMKGTLIYPSIFWELDLVGLRTPEVVALAEQHV